VDFWLDIIPRLAVKKYQLKELRKIIEYILLYRPDEFGLFLDDDDSLPIKELMWALHEETGWKHIRLGHLKELAYSGLELAFTLTYGPNARSPRQLQTPCHHDCSSLRQDARPTLRS
jgi:hypothetical protein